MMKTYSDKSMEENKKQFLPKEDRYCGFNDNFEENDIQTLDFD